MSTVKIADEPDVALIVAQTFTLEVSSEKLILSPKFEAIFSPGSWEGDQFQEHLDEGYTWLFQHHLPDDEPYGLYLLMLALHDCFDVETLHGNDDSGPESRELKGLQSFARMVHHHQFTDIAVVKAAARIAIESISANEKRMYPELVLRSAYLFDDLESFSVLTDNIAKYEGPEVANRLKDKKMGNGKLVYSKLSHRMTV